VAVLRRVLAVAVALVVTAGVAAAVPPAADASPAARSFLRFAAPGTAPAGLGPADIASAYGLQGGVGGTVAIATAYDAPTLEADLAVYRSTFGLPPCTSGDGCLRVVGQRGTSTRPAADVGWAQETSLDVDAVSAACPTCRILVVEADDERLSSLGAAVDTAVRLGADAVSASWGTTEWRTWRTAADEWFTHPGVPIVAATGDDGEAPAVLPAALPGVIAVGGTTLTATAPGAQAPTTAYAVHEGTVTRASTSAAVRRDERALRTARAAHAAAKHRTVVAKHRLSAARAALRHARPAARAHWRHVVASRSAAVAAARRTQSRRWQAVRAAEARLLRDRTHASAEAARAGQRSRAGWIETAWHGAGSGCSAYVPRPAFQRGTMCAGRSIADVAAVADPSTGLAVRDTHGTADLTPDGWLVAGGTSLAAPLVAAMLVRSGHAARYSSAAPLYADPSRFWDVTAGSNGGCAGALCMATPGPDGPTGLGTPRSLAAF